MTSHESLDAESLNSMKLNDLKEECKERGLHYSGTKPVLIGRILDFQQSGDHHAANKRSIDELKDIAEQNPSKKSKNKSKAVKKLEAVKQKSAYMQAMAEQKKGFHELNTIYIGNPTPDHLDFGGACLDIAYDTLTQDVFTAQVKGRQDTLKAANFDAHKRARKEFWEQVRFPELEVLLLADTKMTDETLSLVLSACPKLKALNICNNFQCTGSGLENIHQKCPNFAWISLARGCSDIKVALKHLQKCSNLTTIKYLQLYDLDDECIASLVNTPRLKDCTIAYKQMFSSQSKITQNGIDLLKGSPFELLDFPVASLLSGAAPTTLDFRPTGKLTLDQFKSFVAKCPQLRTVDFENCELRGLNDALTALGDSPCATSIQTVILTHCTDLKDEGIKALGKLTSLRKLGLAFAWQGMWEARNISDATFVQASKSWSHLETLELHFAPYNH